MFRPNVCYVSAYPCTGIVRIDSMLVIIALKCCASGLKPISVSTRDLVISTYRQDRKLYQFKLFSFAKTQLTSFEDNVQSTDQSIPCDTLSSN